MSRKEKDIDVTSETLGPEVQENFLPEGDTGPEAAAVPETFTFKADVANVFKDTYEIVVAGKDGATATLGFAKDELDYEGKGVHELEAGYRGLMFAVPYALAVEKHLVEMLGQSAHAADIKTPVDEGEDKDASQAAPYKKKLREETITVTVVLDPEEREACGQRMADAIERKEDLEGDLDTYRKSVNAQIKEVEKEISEAARLWRRGKEEREVSCDVVADYNTGELVWCEKAHPYTERKRQRMTEKDRQLPLPLDETSASIEAPGASEPAWCDAVTLYGALLEDVEAEDSVLFSVEYTDEGVLDKVAEAEFKISREEIIEIRLADEGGEDEITITRAYAIEAGIIDAPQREAPEAAAERSCETCANLYQQPNAGEDDPCFDCGNDDARPNWQAGEGSEETQPEAA